MPADPNEQFHVGGNFSECIRLGLLHSPSGRFLTAEVFNNEINVSGPALRRRQVWSVLTESGRSDTVYLLGNFGRFLSADKDGKVNAASKTPGSDERFLLEFSPQSTGEWAFKSETHGFYLSGSDTQISCFSKTPVWWGVRLAIHPQVHLRHLFRSRYLRLLPNANELRADQSYPWGAESSIWLEQPAMVQSNSMGRSSTVGHSAVARLGKVALRCQSGQYLRPDGSFSEQMDDSTLFAFEIRPGSPRSYAFRDSTGAYLTAAGPGTIKVRTTAAIVGKEELFALERAAIQVGVLAHNNKFASVKQGSEISANQHEQDETAIFQLEYIGGKGFNSCEAAMAPATLPQSPCGDAPPPWQQDTLNGMSNGNGNSATNGIRSLFFFLVTGLWRLRSHSGTLWRFSPAAAVQNKSADGDPNSHFEILSINEENETIGPGQVIFRASEPNGQTISARKLGAVSCSGRVVNEQEAPTVSDLFRLILVNRPSLAFISMLTGGFLCRGKHTAMDCCGLVCERMELRLNRNKTYFLFTSEQKPGRSQLISRPDGLLQVKPTNINPDEELDTVEPEMGTEFILYFLGNGRILLRCLNGPIPGLALVKAEAKGDVKVESASDILSNYIWEI